jgi:uncharacterized membrane protein
VLIMIQAHTLDAWTARSERSSELFRQLIFLGGFAAPTFLFLSGVGLVFSGERTLAREGRWTRAGEEIITRGLQLFALAFLFRLQAFVVSPGSPLVTVFRVDILNVMGVGVAVAGLVWLVAGTRLRAALVCAAAAAAAAILTPVIRDAAWVGSLPVWFQWYLRPSGEHTTFTLLPWVGFVFAGAAWGLLAGRWGDDRREGRLHRSTAVAGAALIGFGAYAASRPPLFAASEFWTSSPAYFTIRTGVLLCGLSLAYIAARAAVPHGWSMRPLERLGRASLFVYWIHVELVYGYASWPWRHRLLVWQTMVGCAAFCCVMYAAVLLRDHVANKRRKSIYTHRAGSLEPAFSRPSAELL